MSESVTEAPTICTSRRFGAFSTFSGKALLLAACLTPAAACSTELTLPEGFSAEVFHTGIGPRARHIVVRENGDVLVSMRDGELVALRDTNGDGSADEVERRKLPITTGLEIRGPHLYFADTVSVSRINLDDNLMPGGEPETIVEGFPRQGSHATKAIALNEQLHAHN